ncbi:hypothetical protein FLONG3_8957 [Fusarium longipes]|uniref:Uncharacterized protein n=1 Tax=Fusarium longipes TaxID=694270 RepID=A0A395S1E5_9HYPO|nr:hypothetical protein FLONG3_8957 [Fusarium longipes]
MNLSRSLNPHRLSRRQLDRNLLIHKLIDDVTPTKTSLRKAEREKTLGNRRARRRAVQARPARNQITGPTHSARPLAPTSGPSSSDDFVIDIAQSDQHLTTTSESFTQATQVSLAESDKRLENTPGINRVSGLGSFTITPESVASHSDNQNPNSTFTSETFDLGISYVDETNPVPEPNLAVHQTDLISAGDFWDAFSPPDMAATELNRHMEEADREVQRRAAPLSTPDSNSEQESFPAKLTFENGYTSRETILFNDDFKVNFVSQGYLNKLRRISEKPLCLVPVPPGKYRRVLTPDGILAPIQCLLFADLQFESPRFPFPIQRLCFVRYSGSGGVHDAKLILGRSWSDSTKEQAPNWT